jgi:type II secretory pathway pseudopilin PulG
MRAGLQSITSVHIMIRRIRARRFGRANQTGFTLIEQAVSLTVIALLLGTVIVPLQTQIGNRKADETRRMLELAQEMLLGFAAANGYFPCPATVSSNGQEPAGTDHVLGNCPTWHGFLPAALLGYRPTDAQGFALDAWDAASNRIRYAVSPSTIGGVDRALTRVNGMRMAPIATIGVTPLFHVCQSGNGVTANDCGTAVTLASNAAVMVWSAGANALTGGKSAHEAQNPNPNGGSVDRIFVSRIHSDAPGHEFDDLVSWIPATTLVSRIISAGQFTPAGQGAATPVADASRGR